MDYIKSGFLASLPFVAALVGVLFSGVFSDFLLEKGCRSDPSSIATPIVIGLLVTDDSFAPGFVYMTVVTAVGIASYVFLVGRVERVRS